MQLFNILKKFKHSNNIFINVNNIFVYNIYQIHFAKVIERFYFICYLYDI